MVVGSGIGYEKMTYYIIYHTNSWGVKADNDQGANAEICDDRGFDAIENFASIQYSKKK